MTTTSLEQLWQELGFEPTPQQRAAVLHTDGPLYLPAGPGSGKTRVLLWRTVNLIVFHDVPPDQIYLSTFTEKAAHQLREGVRGLLAAVTARTGCPYDTGRMYVGTVHSLCTKLLIDRRFNPQRERGQLPAVMDELDQYLWLARTRVWRDVTAEAGFATDTATEDVNAFFGNTYQGAGSSSRYQAVTSCLQFFNRLSEECVEPDIALERTGDPTLQKLLRLYGLYRGRLTSEGRSPATDLSLLQQHALRLVEGSDQACRVFRHVIVDEYQDTNHVQERIFFRLAAEHRNLCVVGDDDQALYRFRGATVENFVEFPARCQEHLARQPKTILLTRNYRSRQRIVNFYARFIACCDWRKAPPANGHFRVADKEIVPHSADDGPSIVATAPALPNAACAEIAQLVRRLLDEGKVENANQIAFLYPSLKSPHVERMIAALEAVGLRAYAPRANRFLEGQEATEVLGLFTLVFGRPERGDFPGGDYADFHTWLHRAEAVAEDLLQADQALARFVVDRRRELATATADYAALLRVAERMGWNLKEPYTVGLMKRPLHEAPGLSERARRAIASRYVEALLIRREEEGRPAPLEYVIKRATSIDWSVLDLFYRLCGFDRVRAMFDAAGRQDDPDEGPVANLSLLSQYLGRFMDRRAPIITGELLQGGGFTRLFFASYLFALWRRGESEYEDADDPFPKGRVPFLTIHQSKGLEFPVVVLGNPRKDDRGPQLVEKVVRPLLERDGEPLERLSGFDIMRMFYVALSRAKNLLVVAHYRGAGQSMHPAFRQLLDDQLPRIASLDLRTVPAAPLVVEETPRTYSYTADYLHFLRCPRQYMIFRQFDFVPSRSQTMLFGTLVHRTMDDLHQWLIARRTTA
jgi:DNA helicase II / ATP-dependent DNA helicase PcrA